MIGRLWIEVVWSGLRYFKLGYRVQAAVSDYRVSDSAFETCNLQLSMILQFAKFCQHFSNLLYTFNGG